MKLLFDENISYRILKKLIPDYENSIHCKPIEPTPKNDMGIWNYARDNDYVIVTFDEDFMNGCFSKDFRQRLSGFVPETFQQIP